MDKLCEDFTGWTPAEEGIRGLSATAEGFGRGTPTPSQRFTAGFYSVTTGSP